METKRRTSFLFSMTMPLQMSVRSQHVVAPHANATSTQLVNTMRYRERKEMLTVFQAGLQTDGITNGWWLRLLFLVQYLRRSQ